MIYITEGSNNGRFVVWTAKNRRDLCIKLVDQFHASRYFFDVMYGWQELKAYMKTKGMDERNGMPLAFSHHVEKESVIFVCYLNDYDEIEWTAFFDAVLCFQEQLKYYYGLLVHSTDLLEIDYSRKEAIETSKKLGWRAPMKTLLKFKQDPDDIKLMEPVRRL